MDPGRITIAVAAAVVGAVVLILSGLIIAKVVETRRYKAKTRQAALINEINVRRSVPSNTDPRYHDIPQPPVNAHRPRKLVRNSKTRTWKTTSSGDNLDPEVGKIPEFKFPDPLRNPYHLPPAQQVPNTQKDPVNVSVSKGSITPRLSAIAELTDCSSPDSPESRTGATRQVVYQSAQSGRHHSQSTQRYHFPDDDEEMDAGLESNAVEPEKSHKRERSRYTSGAISAAPLSPLPPLPTLDFRSSIRRASQMSMESVKTVSSAFIFDTYWMKKSPSANLGQATQMKALPASNVTRNSISSQRNSGGLQVIDASTWHQQPLQKLSPAHQQRWSIPADGHVIPQNLRYSIASGPFSDELDQKPAVYRDLPDENATGCTPSFKRGHRRQSCVRISGLKPTQPNRMSKSSRRTSCMSETIHEVSESYPSPKLQSRAKCQDENQLSPTSRSPQPLLSPKQSPRIDNQSLTGTNASLRQLRGGSTLFGIFRHDHVPTSPLADDPSTSSFRSQPLGATSPGDLRMNSYPTSTKDVASKMMNDANSRIAHMPRNVQRPSTIAVPKGPRKQSRTSSINRKSSMKPASLRTKSVYSYNSRKNSQNDLRRSVLQLKRLDSEISAQVLQRKDSDNSSYASDKLPTNQSIASQERENIPVQPIQQRKRSSTTIQPPGPTLSSPPNKKRRSRSVSGMLDLQARGDLPRYDSEGTLSNASAWEDEPVKASPDTGNDSRLQLQAPSVTPTRKASPSGRWTVFPSASALSKTPRSGASTPINYLSRQTSFNTDRESQYSVASDLSPQQAEYSQHILNDSRRGTMGLGLQLNDHPWELGTVQGYR